jgi:hypothetical protein
MRGRRVYRLCRCDLPATTAIRTRLYCAGNTDTLMDDVGPPVPLTQNGAAAFRSTAALVAPLQPASLGGGEKKMSRKLSQVRKHLLGEE